MTTDAQLTDIKAALSRVDERTLLTHDLVKAHMERSDDVHDTLHSRINRVALKQNWMLGVGAMAMAMVAGLWEAAVALIRN